jgi:hypothetical protein
MDWHDTSKSSPIGNVSTNKGFTHSFCIRIQIATLVLHAFCSVPMCSHLFCSGLARFNSLYYTHTQEKKTLFNGINFNPSHAKAQTVTVRV